MPSSCGIAPYWVTTFLSYGPTYNTGGVEYVYSIDIYINIYSNWDI